MLISIHKDLVGIVQKTNRYHTCVKGMVPSQPFVKEGIVSSRTPKHYSSILMKYGATDWRINFDFAKNNTIPSETLVDTLQRPDIVIYSI